ncbi:hypothetical protein [Sorangium sp. So ce145]|uniref:hypothetical protein n=1 Tax=Sorangium sp. So ce145 TaxID=3133285 RepID=UPI003F5E8E51
MLAQAGTGGARRDERAAARGWQPAAGDPIDVIAAALKRPEPYPVLLPGSLDPGQGERVVAPRA